MNEQIKKIVELEIDINDVQLDDMGVEVVSLVTEPAIEVDFLAFNKEEECKCEFAEEFESYSDYPDSVKNNAKRGIELNEKVNNKCATQVGKVRAQQLANGEKISVETIKRMYSYLSRAEAYYDSSDTEACGTISFLLWGGKSAKSWAESKLKQLEKLESVDHEQCLILDWAEESGEEMLDDTHVYVSESEFDFESATAVQRAVQGLGILGKLGIKKNALAEIKYRYTGPRDSNNRGFCAGMMRLNKLYSENDLINLKSKMGTLNPGMGKNGANTYNVFAYKGGVNCRHFWQRTAIFRGDNKKVLVIDKGPAQGLAGKDNNSTNGASPSGSVRNNARAFSFSFDEEKRIVAGPFMIPNQMIVRRTPDGEPYYVYFSRDTIRRIQERFNREYKINNTDTQHDGNVHTDNVLLEQWIVESPIYDKSKYYGFKNLPIGTWFGAYKINNDEDWERIKSGELRGFSIAGNFLEKAKEVTDEKADEARLEEIIKILKEIR